MNMPTPLPPPELLLPEDEAGQTRQAERLNQQVFGNDANLERTAGSIREFVRSYLAEGRRMPLEAWLNQALGRHPELWSGVAEREAVARDIIRNVQAQEEAQASLDAHRARGMSDGSWLASQIERGARTHGMDATGKVMDVYTTELLRTIDNANTTTLEALTTRSGNISLCPNLDGFIAEHHHANTFNLDAAAKGSTYRARVITPEPGSSYGKNSMDIGIYDENSKLVKRYQAKYGKDAQSTEGLFKRGNYRGQQKLVPAGQSAEMNTKATETIGIDGVSSTPLSKEEAQKLQRKAQTEAEIEQYEWSDVNRAEVAKTLGKQVLVAAALVVAAQGVRILGRRAWNFLKGEANPSMEEDLQEFVRSAGKSALTTGLATAVSGGLVVAVKNGWVIGLAKETPVGHIVQIASVGIEIGKALFHSGTNKRLPQEILNQVGSAITTSVGAMATAGAGAELGACIGTLLGPVGTAVGGVAGGVLGGMAGSSAGQAIYEGSKKVAKAAAETITKVASSVTDTARNINVGSHIKNFLIG